MRNLTATSVFCLLALLLPLAALAQGPVTGTPPFGSFSGGPDVIDLADLNSHLSIPVLNKPGRGTNFTYNFNYDSSVWYPSTSGSTTSWTPVYNWGWRAQTEAAIGYVSASLKITRTCKDRNGNIVGYDYATSNWAYHDAFGIPHYFPTNTAYVVGTCGNVSPASATGVTGDGSGYVLSVTDSAYTSLYGPTGRSLRPPYGNGTSSGSVTDRNGNEITVNGSGVFTDTLGTTALTVAGSGTPSSPKTLSYTAPSGATATYQINYTNYTVATNFGVSGISEYKSSVAVPLVSSVVLPDGTQYTFAYEATPSIPSSGACTPYSGTTCTTARVTSIGLSTGGTITYAYSGGNDGVMPDGSTATLTRTTPDGTWKYTRTAETGAAYVTKVTDPQNNDTLIQFQGLYETQRDAYQGAAPSFSTFPIPESTLQTSGLLQEIQTCYNTGITACTNTAITLPITQRTSTTQLSGASSWASAATSQHVYKYSSTGSLTEQDDYDYGTGTPGTLLKKTAITYAALTNITSFRQQVTVTNGAGTTISQTNYNFGDTVTGTTGTPQHTTPSGSRGNLLSVNYYTSGSTYLTKNISYFDTGTPQTITDVNGAQTTYTTTSCGNSYPTSLSEPLSLSKSMTWNCTGGTQLTSVDENSQTTTSSFTDPYFWRPASVTDPTSAVANMTYTGQNQAEAVLNFNGTSSTADMFATRDGLGRKHVIQVRETPGSSNFDSTETDYDSLGRVSRVTLPYVGTAGQTNSSAPATSTTYDALNRVLQISDASTGYRSYSYSQNDVYITRGPAPSGENTKRRQEEYDALGRLTSVCEITSGTGSGSCAQKTSQTGFWTQYSYDALGRITGITQNAQSSSTQTRTFIYDLMGRLISETNPENGTTTYTYDTDSICGASNGDLVKKIDAVGNVTCLAYDAFHRPTAATYPSGSYSANTPAKHFVYDAATVNGLAMTNVKGRLAEAYTCTGSCTSKITDEGFSYTVRGETSDVYESTPHSGGYYHVSAQYWANFALKQLNGIPGVPTMTYTPDGEGRVYQVSATSGQNPVTNTVFNAASLPTSITYGSGDSDSYTYDPNTNRLTQYQFAVGSTPQYLTGTLTWNADHTLGSQNITDPFDNSDQQNCAYTHDDLTRIASVNCGSIFSQTFSYDPFGNISKSGTYSFQPTYNSSTNRMTSLGGTTPSYDANGSVLSDGVHTYSWMSDGKSLSVDGVSLTFDALGRMVEQNRSGSYTEIVYGPNGAKLALMNGQTLTKGLIALPGGGQAVYNSSGLLYYGHADHLGSVKFGSTPSRTLYFDLAYAPFGETYATTGTTDPAFTGQRQDTASGLYDFPARQYANQGRWPTPDPSGLASVNIHDPQQLNRYAYVRNNPLANFDPNGLVCDGDWPNYPGDPLANGTGIFTPEDCAANGGTWSDNGTSTNSTQDPTSGGDQQNSGGDVCGINQLCSDGNGSQFTSMDQNDLTVEVTASISADNPTVQTQDATTGTTLQEPDPEVGMNIFTNNPQCPNCGDLWKSTSDNVELYTDITAAEVSIVVGVPAVMGAYGLALENPQAVIFLGDMATGYAKYEDAIPGFPTNIPQWIGFGIGAALDLGPAIFR